MFLQQRLVKSGKKEDQNLTNVSDFLPKYGEIDSEESKIYIKYNEISNEFARRNVSNIFTTSIHIEERMILMSCIRFLTNNLVSYDEKIYCIFAGKVSIYQLKYVSLLFPGVKFIIFSETSVKFYQNFSENLIEFDSLYFKVTNSYDNEYEALSYQLKNVIRQDFSKTINNLTKESNKMTEYMIRAIKSTSYKYFIFEDNIFNVDLELINNLDDRPMYLISYINDNHSSITQYILHYYLNSKASLINFNPIQIKKRKTVIKDSLNIIYEPYVNEISDTLFSGDSYSIPVNSTIYLRGYSDQYSSNTDLEIVGSIKEWTENEVSIVEYENKIKFHNIFIRTFGSFINKFPIYKIGYDNSYDCSYEENVYTVYIDKYKKNDLVNVVELESRDILIRNRKRYKFAKSKLKLLGFVVHKIEESNFRIGPHGYISGRRMSTDTYNVLYIRYSNRNLKLSKASPNN